MPITEPKASSPAPTTIADTAGARWNRLAYAYAVVWSAAAGYVLFRVPFEIGETVGNLLKFQVWPSAGRLFVGTFTAGVGGANPGFMRAWSDATSKLVFDLSGGHYFLTYRLLHVVFILLLMIFLVRLVQVRSALTFGLALVSGAALLGMHTFHETVRETELNIKLLIPVLCFGAVCLSASRPHWAKDLAAVALTFYAAFSNELGLLLWVCVAAAYLVGFRGVSRTGVLGTTAVLALYFFFRFVIWDVGSPPLNERSSGFGFRMLDPPELIAMFGDNPLPLYAYNVVVSALTVFASEPRSGAFVFVRDLLDGTVAPGLVFQVASSLLTTGLMGWFAARRWRHWVRREFEHDDRLFLVSMAVVAANAVISFPYVKEVTMSTAGAFYAIAIVPPLRLLATRMAGRTVMFWRVVVVYTLFASVSLAWTLRAGGFYVDLGRYASLIQQQWSGITQETFSGQANLGEGDLRLVDELRTEMLAIPILRLSSAPRWVEGLDPLH